LKSFKVDGASAPGGGAIDFGVLPGATLVATIKPDKGATDVPGVPLLDGPLGAIDLTGFTELKPAPKASATVADFTFSDLGHYTFTPALAAADGVETLPFTTTLKLTFPKVKKTEHTEHATFLNQQVLPVCMGLSGNQAAAGSLQA